MYKRNGYMQTHCSCFSPNIIPAVYRWLIQAKTIGSHNYDLFWHSDALLFSWFFNHISCSIWHKAASPTCEKKHSIVASSFFLAFDFCQFCVVIRFLIPATTANDLRLRRISIPDFIHYIIFYLNSWDRASISLFIVEC